MNSNRTTGLIYALAAGLVAFVFARAAMATDTGPVVADMPVPGIGQQTYDSHRKRTWRVKCGQGASLAGVLARAKPGDTLKISGTCVESVVIATDRLSLLGEDGATIDGSGGPSEGVVVIDGARRVVLDNLKIQNGADQGLIATHQAQGSLTNLDIRDNGTVGLTVDRSHLEVDGLLLQGNGTSGMDAFASSTVVLKGTITATGNGGDGLVANGKTFLELRGATVDASQNMGGGVSIINDSRLQIFSFPEAQGSSVTADANGFAGISLLGAELSVVGAEFFGSGANVISANDNVLGYLIAAGGIFSPHATAKFAAKGNGVGMVMEDGASALIIGGLDVSDNGAGMEASGAGTLTLVSVPPNPSSVVNNELDISLSFGTRATIDEVNVGSLLCDETVLVRGTVACQ